MKKILYHGSQNIIEAPIFGYGKRDNDYGLGFYCTESIELAKEWSVSEDRDGFANEYQIDLTGLKILNLNDGKYCALYWLAILIENRRFPINGPLAFDAIEYLKKHYSLNYRDYDIIIGYRADDGYFLFASDFLNGTISYQQLITAMHLGNLGEQVVLISEKAFERIKFVRAIKASSIDYYSNKVYRDQLALNSYYKIQRNKGDLYISQIIDEEIKPDDKRLR